MLLKVNANWLVRFFYKLYSLGENRYEMKWLNYLHNPLKYVSFKTNENAVNVGLALNKNACDLENVSKQNQFVNVIRSLISLIS